ncbi:MAG: peptidase M22, partial [Ruminococcaceae bacterium]|nr:peptidase M22 [Oscillospiraceae bacterium]
MSLYLGIDTSNYTTSIATCGDKELNVRRIIDVKEGTRGIRQSDGVFVHLKTLPQLFNSMDIAFPQVKAIGVSTRPRSI